MRWLFTGLLVSMLSSQMAFAATASFRVENMTCSSCAKHVETALKQLNGVKSVDVQLKQKLVRVTYEEQKVKPDAMVRAIKDAGYPAKEM